MGLGKLRGLWLLWLALVPLSCGGDATDARASDASEAGGGGVASEAVGGAGAAGVAPSSDGTASRSYACKGGFVYVRVGGAGGAAGAAGAFDARDFEDVPWTGEVGGASSCVVGQTYCVIASVPDIEVGVLPQSNCESLPPVCAKTPNCACICADDGCAPECSCTDTDGVATLSCQET